MASIRIKTLSGEETSIDEAQVEALSAAIRGGVIKPGDSGYDETRMIWNAMIDRRPALIARCTGAADVMAAIAFARDNQLLASIRGGGHNIAGSAVCDGGLMIDLSPMRWVRVDPASLRAYVGGGATLGDVDHETQAFGLITPLGINSTTGVAGLTLGGGFGWLSSQYGLSIDNLRSADVVTADGTLLHASAEENSDLFWGIRGGGGNFGVVTSFEFELHNVGPEIVAGLIVYPIDQAEPVLRQYRDFVETMPKEMAAWVILRHAPALPFLPPEVHGRRVLVMPVFHVGETESALKQIEPLTALGKTYGHQIGPTRYEAWQQIFDAQMASGARNYWKTNNFRGLSDALISTIVEQMLATPGPLCQIVMGVLGGAVSRVAPDATAYCDRESKYVMNVHGRCASAAEDDATISWARGVFKATAPFASGGAYVNFMTQDEGERVPAAYGPNYARLAEIKAKYDPENLFRMNHNVAPAQ